MGPPQVTPMQDVSNKKFTNEAVTVPEVASSRPPPASAEERGSAGSGAEGLLNSKFEAVDLDTHKKTLNYPSTRGADGASREVDVHALPGPDTAQATHLRNATSPAHDYDPLTGQGMATGTVAGMEDPGSAYCGHAAGKAGHRGGRLSQVGTALKVAARQDSWDSQASSEAEDERHGRSRLPLNLDRLIPGRRGREKAASYQEPVPVDPKLHTSLGSDAPAAPQPAGTRTHAATHDVYSDVSLPSNPPRETQATSRYPHATAPRSDLVPARVRGANHDVQQRASGASGATGLAVGPVSAAAIATGEAEWAQQQGEYPTVLQPTEAGAALAGDGHGASAQLSRTPGEEARVASRSSRDGADAGRISQVEEYGGVAASGAAPYPTGAIPAAQTSDSVA